MSLQASTSNTPLSEQRMAARSAANLRTVARNDTAVVEILETSTYCVIYHWDEGTEKWDKQKMEGPMFIVRRDKAPQYALYLLNRQAVKNVLIPLTPGDMRVSVVDQNNMHIARRGERLRRSIWFSEGEKAAQAFMSGIIRICG
ncbi:hypothetical protein TREMEDRAFT_56356, partial [Tremella mesenterica DSM 1558]